MWWQARHSELPGWYAPRINRRHRWPMVQMARYPRKRCCIPTHGTHSTHNTAALRARAYPCACHKKRCRAGAIRGAHGTAALRARAYPCACHKKRCRAGAIRGAYGTAALCARVM